MVQDIVFENASLYPGPSSQTTTNWPLSVRVDDEHQLVSNMLTLEGGIIVAEPADESTWDEVADEVLRDRAELWRRLADL